MKRWNLDIIGYRVIGTGCLTEKDLELVLFHLSIDNVW